MRITQPGRPPARPPAVRMPRFTPEQKARIGAAIDAIVKRVREALAPLFRLVRQAAEALSATLAKVRPQVEALATTVKNARRDRPAWASPYGPAPRRSRP